MKFVRYTDSSSFLNATLDILLEHEAMNLSMIKNLTLDRETSRNKFEEMFAEKGWEDESHLLDEMDKIFWSHPQRLFATVNDSNGSVLLTAYCNYPYKTLMLFGTRNNTNANAVKVLTDEIKSIDFDLSKIRAEQELASCFTEAYGGEFVKHSSVFVMQAGKVLELPRSPGFYRMLEEKDLHFAPFWHAECLKACHQEPLPLNTLYNSLLYSLEEKSAYLWEDAFPVSQAVINSESTNCAQIGDVYTPPYFRKKGYATSLVAEVSRIILSERGKRFSVLCADAENPTSCGIYRKIGYKELCIVDELSIATTSIGQGVGNEKT